MHWPSVQNSEKIAQIHTGCFYPSRLHFHKENTTLPSLPFPHPQQQSSVSGDIHGEARKGQKGKFSLQISKLTYLRWRVAHPCSTGNEGSRRRCSEVVQPPGKGMLHHITERWHGETTFKIKETKVCYFSPWYDGFLQGGIF